MLKIIKIGIVVSLLVYSQFSMAAREFADIYVDCGLGAMIAPTNDIVAVVTNVTFDLGTTAIISNASSPETCKGGKARIAAFINESYETLEKELANGTGTYLDSLMVLAGHESQQVASLRSGFAKIVANPNYINKSHFEKSNALYDLVVNI
ncbi:DUF3015 family protein [Thiotrichales bacterium HSG1]|nr:DUF3015 family protein [Thiotrichales bacterium HSG1]